jgi:hypothetical protein
MYDSDADCFYPAEENYHEDRMLQEAEDFDRDFYGDDDHIPSEDDGDYDDLLDQLEFPF